MGWTGPMTHRQYEVWQEWLEADWDRPSRTDHYLMQVACEVARVLAKDRRKIRMDWFKLRLSRSESAPAETVEQASERWRRRALGRFPAGSVTVRYATREELGLPPRDGDGGTADDAERFWEGRGDQEG